MSNASKADIPTECSICLGSLATPEEKDRFKGGRYGFLGHNAAPVNGGRCCTQCNNDVVIPTRIRRVQLRNANV
jgi:hypothetical protein